jgi:hypothetical protein
VIDADFRNNVARLAWAHKLVTDLYSSHLRVSCTPPGGLPKLSLEQNSTRVIVSEYL